MKESLKWIDLLYLAIFVLTLLAMAHACQEAGEKVRSALENVRDVKLEDIHINLN